MAKQIEITVKSMRHKDYRPDVKNHWAKQDWLETLGPKYYYSAISHLTFLFHLPHSTSSLTSAWSYSVRITGWFSICCWWVSIAKISAGVALFANIRSTSRIWKQKERSLLPQRDDTNTACGSAARDNRVYSSPARKYFDAQTWQKSFHWGIFSKSCNPLLFLVPFPLCVITSTHYILHHSAKLQVVFHKKKSKLIHNRNTCCS